MKGEETMTDSKIIDMFFDRNEAAISECDVKYGIPLRRFGNRITNDVGTTEECVDDTYMRAWETIPPKEPRDHLFVFLSKILRNKCLDRLKFSKREKRDASVTVLSEELDESVPGGDSADAEVLSRELTSLIEKFLSGLKDDARSIFVLRYFYMYDIRDIAERLSFGEGKVKTSLKRTRDKLRIFLETYHYTYS